MEGKATVDVKPPTLYLHAARPQSRLSTPQPPDQLGFPNTFMQSGVYGYPPGAIPQVTMPMWGYPTHGLGPSGQPGHYIGTPAPIMNPAPTCNNFATSNEVESPDIVAWFAFLDQHERRNKDPITFAPYGVMLKAKGFLRLSQLTLEYIQLRDLQEWLGIEVGTAILIMQYAKEDMQALQSGKWVFPTDLK